MQLIVVFHTEDGARYGVTVPDLPGCISAGDSLDEALENVVKAIDLHLDGLRAEGSEIPRWATVAEQLARTDITGEICAVVDVRDAS